MGNRIQKDRDWGVPKDWEVRALGEFINVFLVNTLSFLNLHFQVCNV